MQYGQMKRREVMSLVGGAAVWPLAGRAAPAASIPRIGIIADGLGWDHFREGLHDLGYVAGQNIVIEQRSADANVERLRQAARHYRVAI
jgi:putative ABC transport system substrate-binding protein